MGTSLDMIDMCVYIFSFLVFGAYSKIVLVGSFVLEH